MFPGWGRSPGGGNGTPLQYSYLKNPMDGGARWATVHGIARGGHNLATKPTNQLHSANRLLNEWYISGLTLGFEITKVNENTVTVPVGLPVALMVKNPADNARDIRDAALIPGWGRSPGGGHGHPLQYSCLENPMDRRAWQAAVHGVTKSWTGLSD